MAKPSQYPGKYTLPMRHIHHSTIVWLDPVKLVGWLAFTAVIGTFVLLSHAV